MRNKRFKRWVYFRTDDQWYVITRINKNEISLVQKDEYGADITNTKRAIGAEEFLFLVLGGDVIIQSRRK